MAQEKFDPIKDEKKKEKKSIFTNPWVIGGIVVTAAGAAGYIQGKRSGRRDCGRAYANGQVDMYRCIMLKPEYKGDFSNTEKMKASLDDLHRGQTIDLGGRGNGNNGNDGRDRRDRR